MADEGFKRKLTAILSADAVEYSRLMGEDEDATVRTLKSYREILYTLIQQHNGKVLDSQGDNLLAEFVSVVDAVQCAVAVQKEIKARNDELPENRRMQFRIGINLGDVIQEEGRIYGDGVNIAARLEGLAEPGGICISKTAFDHIESKLPYGYDYLGDQTVKNISKPIGAYRVLMDPRVTASGKPIDEKFPITKRRSTIVGAVVVLAVVIAVGIWQFYGNRVSIEPASVDKMAFQLPDKPSIAVLPFDNMSKDTKQDFFVDAISENIITTLAKSPYLFVIARNSTFTYKGKPVKIAQVSEELGVRYVLEGSFLKSGDRIRITTQLIDALKGGHVWAETYDRDFKDVLTIIDDITLEIAKALSIELMPGMKGTEGKVLTKNLEAWTLFAEGSYYLDQYTEEDLAKAKELLERTIEIDPNFSMAWAFLSSTHAHGIRYGFSPFKTESSYVKATKLALKSIELDDSNSTAYTALGDINLFQRNYDKAQTHYKKAITVNPNDAIAIYALGRLLRFSGQPDEAVPLIKKSIRLDPHPYWNIPYNLGRAYYQSRQYDDAIVVLEEVLKMCEEGNCNPKWPHMQLSQVYAELGQIEKARSHMQKVLEQDPKFNLESRRKANPYKNPADNEREIAALRKAGAPERPPLQSPDKPSIAVMPFNNISGDPEFEYVCDGLSENIISALSKIPDLLVIASNSTFYYKDKQVQISQVGRELDVRYVLEGSVLKSGDQVRINAQLIDAVNGNHVWSETYDRKWKDFLSLLDEITLAVARALTVEIGQPYPDDLTKVFTDNLEAWLAIQKATFYALRATREDNAKAKDLAKKAIDLDPKYIDGYIHLAFTLMAEARWGWAKSPGESMNQAKELLSKALEIDETDYFVHYGLGMLNLMERNHDEALVAYKRAVKLGPNLATTNFRLARCLVFLGQPEEALPFLNEAKRLNPHFPWVYYPIMARIYFHTGRYEEALAECEGMREVCERGDCWMYFPHLYYAMVYEKSGQHEKAQYHMKKVLEENPRFNLESRRKASLFKNKEDTDREMDALRKAGAPENPPKK